MAFSAFSTLDQVLVRYGLRQVRSEFVEAVPHPPASTYYRDELRFSFEALSPQRSEAFAGEAFIFPTLKEVWRHYREHLSFFSHEAVEADAELRGELDYMVCRRSRHGPFTPDQPILLVGEAKRDDIQKGWAQALVGMMAARRLAPQPAPVLYGLSTTGASWSFGKLEDDLFTQDPRSFDILRVDDLLAALHYVFSACRDQVLAMPPAAA